MQYYFLKLLYFSGFCHTIHGLCWGKICVFGRSNFPYRYSHQYTCWSVSHTIKRSSLMFQLLKALRGDAGIIECGLVASDVTEAKYFSTPLELGVGKLLVSLKLTFFSILHKHATLVTHKAKYCTDMLSICFLVEKWSCKKSWSW